MATMTLNVIGNPIVPCGPALNVGGNIGIYEVELNMGSAFGYTGIKYDGASFPDRFEVFYNNVKIGDSKFVGDAITSPGNPYGSITLGNYTLDNYIYNGEDFVATGVTTPITITSAAIANNTSEATNGNGVLLFNKTIPGLSNILVRITGSPSAGTTAWQITGICPVNEDDIITGEEKIMYTFFTEPNKALQTRSSKFILGDSPIKFYTDILGDINFDNYGYSGSLQYMNDGINWWRIDADGNILDTGLI